jgi:hypothetical protein
MTQRQKWKMKFQQESLSISEDLLCDAEVGLWLTISKEDFPSSFEQLQLFAPRWWWGPLQLIQYVDSG